MTRTNIESIALWLKSQVKSEMFINYKQIRKILN